MRTKSILLAAAIGVASVASTMAQAVYSVNAVGYVNITFPTGFRMFSNPLLTANSTVAALFPTAPDGAQVFKFTPPGGYQISNFDIDAWDQPNLTIENGGGAWFRNPGAQFTQTFVGEVPEGAPLNNAIVAGFQQKSSQVPQTGPISSVLLYPAADGDQLFKFVNPTGYQIYNFDIDAWSPSEPVIDVGDAFFLRRASTPTSWTRSFDVTP
jgi:hypothetical protein